MPKTDLNEKSTSGIIKGLSPENAGTAM